VFSYLTAQHSYSHVHHSTATAMCTTVAPPNLLSAVLCCVCHFDLLIWLLCRYLEAVTGCSRSAHLGRLLAVGAGSAIGGGCVVSQSVIGRGCSIGKNCRLTGCYLQVRPDRIMHKA
jgi:hypothetical protein